MKKTEEEYLEEISLIKTVIEQAKVFPNCRIKSMILLDCALAMIEIDEERRRG